MEPRRSLISGSCDAEEPIVVTSLSFRQTSQWNSETKQSPGGPVEPTARPVVSDMVEHASPFGDH